jgi:hypothetical protein
MEEMIGFGQSSKSRLTTAACEKILNQDDHSEEITNLKALEPAALQELLLEKVQELISNRFLVQLPRLSTEPTIVPPVVRETKKRAASDAKSASTAAKKKAKSSGKGAEDTTEEVIDLPEPSADSSTSSSSSSQSKMYRVSFDEVLRRLRHKAVVDLTRQRLGSSLGQIGARIVECVLNNSLVAYISLKHTNTHIYMYIHTFIYTYMHTHTHTYVYICIYIHAMIIVMYV